jgi:integrase/recombinase XerD
LILWRCARRLCPRTPSPRLLARRRSAVQALSLFQTSLLAPRRQTIPQDGSHHEKWDVAYELARRVEKQLDGNGTQPNPSYSTTIAHAVNSYLADKRAQQLSTDTLKKLERIFKKQLLSWCEAHEVINIEKLDLTKLREWRATWSAKKKQERVVGFFHFCQSEGWVSDNPARRLSRIKVTQKPTDYFTSDEYDKLIEGTKQIRNGDRLQVLMELMRWSGLSIRDAVTLERSRLNQYDQILLYRAGLASQCL